MSQPNLWSYPVLFHCTGAMGAAGSWSSLRLFFREEGELKQSPGALCRGIAMP
jgi:hypothetical protein